MEQQTLAMAADHNVHFEKYRKRTRRDKFLATMGKRVPWAALCSVIQPHYLKGGNGLNSTARPTIGLERMLRMHFVQHWFNVADEAGEDPGGQHRAEARRARIAQRAWHGPNFNSGGP